MPSRLGADVGESPQAQNALIRERLQDTAERDLQDGFVFRIGAPMADLDAAPYGGARYPIEARLDNRIFATFHLDVGVGDAIATPPEWLTGQDLLGFAGFPPAHAAALSREQQFAEKVHAYTLPRGERTNTRVKDLVDLVLLLQLGLADADTVRQALHATFTANLGKVRLAGSESARSNAPSGAARLSNLLQICSRSLWRRSGLVCPFQ